MAAVKYTVVVGTPMLVGGGIENAAAIMAIHVPATGGTLTVSGALDQAGATNKVDLQMMPFGSSTAVSSANAAGAWRVDVAGIDRVYLSSASADTVVWVNHVNG